MTMFADPFPVLQALADLNAAREAAKEFLTTDTSLADLADLADDIDTALEGLRMKLPTPTAATAHVANQTDGDLLVWGDE